MFLVVENHHNFYFSSCKNFAEKIAGINQECILPQKEFQQGLKS